MTATISGSAVSTLVALTTTGNTILGDASTDTLNVGNGDLVKDASGNVGIGVTSVTGKCQVKAATNQSLYIGASTTIANSVVIGGINDAASANIPLEFRYGTTAAFINSGTEAMRIDSTGQLLVGCTVLPASGRTKGFGAKANTTGGFQVYQTSSVSDWALSVTSGSCVNFYSDNGSTLVYAGSINVSGSTTSYTSVSDYRLKENVQPMTGALANVLALKPVTFTFKDSGQDSQGFIAHELQAVVPDAVTGIKDAVREEQYEVTPAVKDADGNTITEAVMGTRTVPDYQGIDTSFLVATLTAAIQELNTRLTALENK